MIYTPLTELLDLQLISIKNKLESQEKYKINELKLFDIISSNGKPLPALQGIYIFFDPQDSCLYVGKNSSQQFIERIPWHFAQSDDSYSNHFIKKYRKDKDIEDYHEAALALGNCKILLIPANYGVDISYLEKVFMKIMQPKYNAKQMDLDASKLLKDVL